MGILLTIVLMMTAPILFLPYFILPNQWQQQIKSFFHIEVN